MKKYLSSDIHRVTVT